MDDLLLVLCPLLSSGEVFCQIMFFVIFIVNFSCPPFEKKVPFVIARKKGSPLVKESWDVTRGVSLPQ